jgi:hypothetical protein
MTVGLASTRSGVSSEAQSNPNVVTPLIHTLDTFRLYRPDKYKRQRKESNEASDK